MNATVPQDVFICHATVDKESVVRPLKEACHAIGISPWVDDDEFKWGDSIAKRIQEGLVSSRYVLVVISEASVSKKWPDKELHTALHVEIFSGQVRLLPLLYCNPEEILARYPFIAEKSYELWKHNPIEIANQIKARIKGRTIKTPTPGPRKGSQRIPLVRLIETVILVPIVLTSFLFWNQFTNAPIAPPAAASGSQDLDDWLREACWSVVGPNPSNSPEGQGIRGLEKSQYSRFSLRADATASNTKSPKILV
jgi:hypothetical protein